jgi:pimeloyl-ACP methyl ester carboxylesterase
MLQSTNPPTQQSTSKVERTVTSRDGTSIALEQSGGGPILVIVAAAMSDRSGTARLAKQLAEHFTVINYDRRGRGKSGDVKPYAVDREVEDVAAVIDASGGSAFLFGSSSGAVLALEAADKLRGKVKKVFMYEPPFIIDGIHPPMPNDLIGRIDDLVSAKRNDDAVKLFFTKGMGIPSPVVTLMRWLMPGWSKMSAMAHTISYDLAILEGTQTGHPFPVHRWSTPTPVLVMVGAKSEPFFHNGARALVTMLPHAEYRVLEGRGHSAVLMASASVADALRQYFLED